jgi:ubiquinone/menaquinone biosynthesis C-methylase UbiE
MEIREDRLHRDSWLKVYGGEDSIGIDIDPEYVKLAKKRISNGTQFIVADARYLPFKGVVFDHIHISGVLHHMKEPDFAVMEIARVAKEGSWLYMMESVSNNPIFSFFRKLAGKWRGDKVESVFSSAYILQRLEEFHNVTERNYYWRSIISDAVAYFGKEPEWSLWINNQISRLLSKVGLDKKFCCHFVLKAVRR